MAIIGYHSNNEVTADSWGYTNTATGVEALDVFMDEMYRKQGNLFYNLEAGAASVCRRVGLTRPEAEKLVNEGRVYITPYTLKYYPNKALCLDRGSGAYHPYTNIYNAEQYAEAELSPDYDPVKLAESAAETGKNLTAAYAELGLPLHKMASPISAYLAAYGDELNPPTVDDMPEEAGKLAFRAAKGGWREAFACGYWEHAYDYDINSAYASEMAKLMDIRRGKWTHGRRIPDDAVYGWAEGKLTTHAEFHPFLQKSEDETTCTPLLDGKNDVVALGTLRFMEKYQLGEFAIEDGWWWTPNPSVTQAYPFRKPITDLYARRKSTDNQWVKDVIRRILAGLWGKTGEFKREEMGRYFNPAYYDIVENNITLRVAATCLDAGIVPLHVAVDGVITDRPLPVDCNGHIGSWRLAHEGRCIIINSGCVGFEGKGGREEFSLTYDWLVGQILANPKASAYTMRKWTSVNLRKALDGDYGRLGELTQTEKTIRLGYDNKRAWRRRAETGEQLLSTQEYSMPLDAVAAGVRDE